MEAFRVVTGVAAPLPIDDVNTDQIAPLSGEIEPDYAALLFARRRRDPQFVLNRPQYRSARILVARENFGSGSSRESAVWALMAFGIRVVVARSFAELFRENALKNGLLPVVLESGDRERFEEEVAALDGGAAYTVDLVAQRITGAGGSAYPFEIPPQEKKALLEGLDDIGLTLTHLAAIEAWEERTRVNEPWMQHLPEGR